MKAITCFDLNSISAEFMRYVESKGHGKAGVDLFAHDWPNPDTIGQKEYFMFIDTSSGSIRQLLSGEVTCINEWCSVFSKAVSEKRARDMLKPVVSELLAIRRIDIGSSHYMSVHATAPVHFIGADRNNMLMCEIALEVLRHPKN